MINPEAPIVIDSATLASGSAYKATAFILSSQYWHKIYVYNVEQDSRDMVLSTLMEAARPHDFIPVNYKLQDDQTATFILKNCGQAIMQFCSNHLIVPHPVDKTRLPYKLKISLCEMLSTQFTVCMKPIVVKILKKRYDRGKKKLNLDMFHTDTELTEFFHLSQSKLLYFVLHLSRDLKIETLILTNNDIESLHPFENMSNEKFLKSLTNVDLSNNRIKSLEELNYLRNLPIKVLNLDGNSCCNDFKDLPYLKSVTKILPNITKLDGCFVSKLGLPPCRRNFICTQSGHELVDKFLEHYFSLYDSNLRALLSGMYHKEAMFSLSTQYLPDQSSSKITKLSNYRKYARNLKTLMDLSKSNLMMFVGSDMIANILTALPPTEHDPNTFTVDVPKFEGSLLAISVSGVYKHQGIAFATSTEMYNFMRTFLLIRQQDDEYKIINDIINVSNVTTFNESVAFRVSKEPEISFINVPLAKNVEQMDEMLESMVVITFLKKEWAKKCLQECKYDLKKALNLFANLHKQDKLPAWAFYSDEETMLKSLAPVPIENPPETKIETSKMECPDDRILTNTEIPATLKIEESNLTPFTYGPESVEAIYDQFIKRISYIDHNTAPKETQKILDDAAKSVLANYKNPWHFCYVGLHMYKNGFIEEARKLIAKSEFILTPEHFRKISMDFLLFEIEYGEARHVDSLLRRKILMDSVDTVLEFILNNVPSISRGMTRALFRRMCEYKLPMADIRKIIIAFKKFELVYGTAETLEHALYMEDKHFPTRKRSYSRSPTRGSTNSQQTSSSSKSYQAPNKKPRSFSRSPPRISQTSTENSAVDERVDFSMRSERDILKKTANAQFEDYKLKVLKLIGVHVDTIKDPSVQAIVDFQGDNKKLISMCDSALKLYNNRYTIVAIIYKKYWERNMVSNIRDLLAQAKDFTDKGLVNNLIVLFKIRMQLQQRNKSETLDKINMHLNKISFEENVNFFVTLSHEKGENISVIFESCLENDSIGEKIKRVIILLYKTYCTNNNLDCEKYKKYEQWYGFFNYAANDNLFNFDKMLELMKGTPDPFSLTDKMDIKQVRTASLEYLRKHNYTLFNCVHLVRFLFLKQHKDMALQTIFQCNRIFSDNPEAVMANKDFHFGLMVALLSPNTRKSAKKLYVWKDQFETNVNYIGTLVETFLMRGSTQLAKSTIANYLRKIIILDVEVQMALFHYFESWKKKFGINMLSMALTVAEKDAAKDNHSVDEEVFISSEED